MKSSSRSGSIEDLRATFICLTNSANGTIKTADDLTRALQRCGRNPSEKNVQAYWKKYETIGIEEFIKIGNLEEKVSERDLLDAFRAIDVNRDGYISAKEFSHLFTSIGDRMTSREIKQILEEADTNNDGRINYREFTKLFISTIEKCKQVEYKRMQKLVTQKDFESQYFTKDKSRHSSLRSSRSYDDLDVKNDLKHTLMSGLKREASLDSSRRNVNHRKSHRSNSGSDTERSRHDYLESSMRSKLSDKGRYSSRSREKEAESEMDLKKSIKKKGKFLSIGEKKHQATGALIDDFSEPRNLRRWLTKTIKGGFYFNESLNGIVSNSFAIDLKKETSIYLTIETFRTDLHTNEAFAEMDASIIVVKNGRNLVIKGLTENKIKNKWAVKLNLDAGRYYLFPFTSGCHLKKRAVETSRGPPKFFRTDSNNRRTLSRQFKDALTTIFDMCDLDSTGRLTKEELNLYTFLTANENISDEEWKFVGETVGFERNELTKEAFIELSKIEASRDDTDIEDITMRVNNMGFNKSLTIDQSCPYTLNVSCENGEFDLLIGEIYKLKAAEKFICQLVEQRGIANELKNFTVYEYSNNYFSYITIKNQTRHDLCVEVDCSKSENAQANSKNLISSVSLKPEKIKVAMILTCKDKKRDWVTRCSFMMNEDKLPGSSRFD